MADILVVDDEASVCRLLGRILGSNGHACTFAYSAAEARDSLKVLDFELVLCDIRMPGESGLDFIEYALSVHPDMAAVIVSGVDERDVADSALKMGVYGYLIKPFKPSEVMVSVTNALLRRRLEMENRAHRDKLEHLVEERTAELSAVISRLQRAERGLRRGEEKYRRLVDNLPGVVYTSYKDRSLLFADEKIENLTYYNSSDLRTRKVKWSDVIHEDDVETTRRQFEKAFATTRSFVMEYRIKRPIGDTIWVQDRGAIICNAGGELEYVSGVLFDITHQKRAEEALETERERFRKLVENAPIGVSLITRDGVLKYVNPEFVRLLGYTLDDISDGTRWFKSAFPEHKYRTVVMDILKNDLKNAEPTKRTLSMLDVVCKDGSEKVILVNTVPIDSENRVVIFSDITEQKKAECELKESHTEMEQLFDSISSILIGIDGENRVIRWNRVAEDIFGCTEQETIGKLFLEVPISWDWDQVLKGMFVCQRKNRPIRMDDIRFTQRNGKDGFLGISFNPILSRGVESEGVLILAADITERRLLESQLTQAQKLESIGQLAAGIAHEINTPTQYVGDNLRFLNEGFDDLLRLIEAYRGLVQDHGQGIPIDGRVQEIADLAEEIDLEYLMEELPKSVAESLEGVGRVAKIVLSMKEFSHPGSEDKSLTDINRAIESTITVARNEWKYVSDMVMDLDPSLPLVSCIPGELNQVILNIIINAAHAIKDKLGEHSDTKGAITVATRRKDETCEIRISDTGPGIPEKIRDRIFDPFFTTKEVGRGTGQGLAISHTAIVEKHGGSISFETEMGKGTTFIIRLPMVENLHQEAHE
ncbi:MAG: PAS domain S-box protein [Deltaproteobacteria bacterium]|nr:PAS domain S-box protein [Deltaproteobacteria bacterium]